MELSVSRDALLGCVGAVNALAARKTTMPVLGCVLLSAADGRLRARCTDLDVHAESEAAADVTRPGEVAVDARVLSAWVIASTGPVTWMTAVDGAGAVQLRNGRNATRMLAMHADEFPKPMRAANGQAFEAGLDVLRTLLAPTVPFCSTDESRAVLNGVHLVVDGAAPARAEATDGKVLSVSMADVAAPSCNVILPSRLVRQVLSLNGPDPVRVEIGESYAVFRQGDRAIGGRLIAGRFPDTVQVIPAQWSTTVTVDKARLLESIKRVVAGAHEDGHALTLDVSPAGFRLKVECPRGSAEDECPADAVGSPATVGLNPRFLTHLLTSLDGADVELRVSSPTDAVIVTQPKKAHQVMVVMPMRWSGT